MFVVWVRTLQPWYVGVGHGVIPPEGFALMGDFVEVLEDAVSDEVDLLKHT